MARGSKPRSHGRKGRSAPTKFAQRDADVSPLDHAVRLIHPVCCFAGSGNFVADMQSDRDPQGLRSAIVQQDTAAIFDSLVSALSYQGISDQVATNYMDQHGRVTWRQIETGLSRRPPCPKLQSYWHFRDCRYDKASRTCAEPEYCSRCPLPVHPLRNGRLNQTAYSLFLFIRDIADGDFVNWIDGRLKSAAEPNDPARVSRMREALIEPLRNVYGVADKVLTMALSTVLLAADDERVAWREVGASMIAIDTLVHNFLYRTGILNGFDAKHAYGPSCYRPGGCAAILQAVAEQIDARQFNPAFPKVFPRFVQHAVWRYCAQQGLNVCNGNRIDDRKSCANIYCRIYSICERIHQYSQSKKVSNSSN